MNNARRKQIGKLLVTLGEARTALETLQGEELFAVRRDEEQGPADSLYLAVESLGETLNHLEDALRPD